MDAVDGCACPRIEPGQGSLESSPFFTCLSRRRLVDQPIRNFTIRSSEHADRARVLVAVCTLNEADNIIELVTGIRRSIPSADVLVVDDNSPDGTAGLVAEMGQRDPLVKVVVRKGEKGLGGAIRHAMAYAIEHDYDFFLNLDGDLSHNPAQLASLLDRAIGSSDIDVVIGSRYVNGGSIEGWPLHRKVMSRMVNGFATKCLRLPVRDCSGSMRCYRVAALQAGWHGERASQWLRRPGGGPGPIGSAGLQDGRGTDHIHRPATWQEQADDARSPPLEHANAENDGNQTLSRFPRTMDFQVRRLLVRLPSCHAAALPRCRALRPAALADSTDLEVHRTVWARDNERMWMMSVTQPHSEVSVLIPTGRLVSEI